MTSQARQVQFVARHWSRRLVQQQAQQQSQIAPVVPVRCWSDGLVGLLVATIGRSLSDGRIAWSGCWYWSVSYPSKQQGAPRLLVVRKVEQGPISQLLGHTLRVGNGGEQPAGDCEA